MTSISDHFPQFLIIPVEISHLPRKHNIYKRNTKNFDKENFIAEIVNINWPTILILIIIKIFSNSQAINFASTNCSSCLEGKLHWDVVPIFVECVFKAVDAFGVDNIFREFVPFVNGAMKTSSSGLLGFHLSRNSELVGMCAFYLIDPYA